MTANLLFQASEGKAAAAKSGVVASAIGLAAFSAALFVSAALMFAVQPMFTRMVLPVLGGASNVWAVAMVFFQAVLLLGYLYAHAAGRLVPVRWMALAHLALMLAACFALPVALAKGWDAPPQSGAAFWLVGLFGASLGLPFFALAGNGPLLQLWFARSGHRHAADPYFLYGASNLGSFCGLLLYPAVFEPLLTLGQQSQWWTFGFVALMGLIAAAGALAIRAGDQPVPVSASAAAAAPAARLKVVFLSFVPSALLVATTTQLTTDIVAAPFIWVIPLALYLLTFSLAFRASSARFRAGMLKAQAWLAGAAVLLAANAGSHDGAGGMLAAMAVTIGMFFVSAMVAHGGLYSLRPPVARLTEFYFLMSLGGVAGGAFCALIAPQIFSSNFEYPILLALALACRPGVLGQGWRGWAPAALGLAGLAALLSLPAWLGGAQLPPLLALARFPALAAAMVAIMLSGQAPGRLIGVAAAALILGLSYPAALGATQSHRSFFGVHRIIDSPDGRVRLLLHGTTIHGAQFIDAASAAARPEPLTYYYEGGPMWEAIAAARERRGALADVAVVGLGAGTLACAARPGESWRFFEIDPLVASLATDRRNFRFLADCAPGSDIVLGDARLTLASDARRYDVIVLDAFSSDAIPAHLLTTQAMALYQSRLKPGGLVILHISNRHMRLEGVVARVAQQLGLLTWFCVDKEADNFLADLHSNAAIAIVAKSSDDIGGLRERGRWGQLAPDPAIDVWSDDHSNVLQAIWRQIAN